MRIAQLAPPTTPVSPRSGTPVGRSICVLADGLVDAGNEVILLASGGSQTRAQLVEVPPREEADLYALVEHLAGAHAVIDGADVVHDHTDLRALVTALNGHPGIVHTLREDSLADGGKPPTDVGRLHLVATSQAQAVRHPDLAFEAVIHDGVRVDDLPLVRHRDDRIVYLGPASPEGGPLIAIAVAELLGCELVMGLRIEDATERSYWRDTLAWRVRDSEVIVRVMPMPTGPERQAIVGRSRALVLPAPLLGAGTDVVLEAGAMGTPVVTFEGDGAAEFIEDGVTGFLVSQGDAGRMAEAVERASTIDPGPCRAHVHAEFSHGRMVRRYAALYERVLDVPRVAMADRPSTFPTQDESESRGSVDRASTYLAAIAHDVRGPLAAVSGFAQTLVDHDDDLDPAERKHMLRRIIDITRRLDQVARNILDTDRLARGGVELAIENVSLEDLCDELMEAIDPNGHRITVDLQEDIVRADRVALERILSNLVSNAVRHTPRGTDVSVGSWRDDGSVVIAVEDDGPGVPDGLLDAISVSGRLSENWNGGSGLGIGLVRRLAELHDGRLTVANRNRGGASFQVRLPLVEPDGRSAEPTSA